MTNLLKKFQSRIESGVQSDLLDLVRCQYLNSRRARAFYKAGFTSLSKLAKADLIDVIAILKARFKFILELIIYSLLNSLKLCHVIVICHERLYWKTKGA